MGNENTHVANACEDEIRIYFQVSKLNIRDFAHAMITPSGVDIKDNVADYLLSGAKVHVVLNRDSKVECIKCASKEFVSIPDRGALYITITCSRDSEDELMCYNMYVPSDRSIIVTENGLIKFAKQGTLWMDESGKQW